MATKRTQTVALVAVVAVLTSVLWYEFRGGTAGSATASSNQQAERLPSETTGQTVAPTAVEGVRLADLNAPRPAPGENDRNPFRFKPPKPPPPPPPPKVTEAPTPIVPPLPIGPPQPPPITLKFIGIVDAPGQAGKLAVLSDTKGVVLYGAEGQTVDGRYKIIKIGVESLEISYIDGRGRTTLRLTG